MPRGIDLKSQLIHGRRLSNCARPCLKKEKEKEKEEGNGTGDAAQWKSTCLACKRLSVQSLLLPEKKSKKYGQYEDPACGESDRQKGGHQNATGCSEHWHHQDHDRNAVPGT